MENIKKTFGKITKPSGKVVGAHGKHAETARITEHAHTIEVDKDKFAKAVVRDYGETLVLLGKE